jgi:hypothetical protein
MWLGQVGLVRGTHMRAAWRRVRPPRRGGGPPVPAATSPATAVRAVGEDGNRPPPIRALQAQLMPLAAGRARPAELSGAMAARAQRQPYLLEVAYPSDTAVLRRSIVLIIFAGLIF